MCQRVHHQEYAHKSQEHGQSYKHTCGLCGKVFVCTERFVEHDDVHNQIRPNVCNRCSASFGTQCARHCHLKICGTEKSIWCPERYKTFRHTKSLSVHMALHKSVEMCHQCLICGKQFTLRWSLRRHEKQKHQWASYKQTIVLESIITEICLLLVWCFN